MIISLNGRQKELADNQNLEQIIKLLCKKPDCVITEVNENIVKHTDWQTTNIKDGDTIEIVTFVGGG